MAGAPQRVENPYGRVGGWFFQEIIPLCGSILQAGTCQILSLAENLRGSRVWQYQNIDFSGQKVDCVFPIKGEKLLYCCIAYFTHGQFYALS